MTKSLRRTAITALAAPAVLFALVACAGTDVSAPEAPVTEEQNAPAETSGPGNASQQDDDTATQPSDDATQQDDGQQGSADAAEYATAIAAAEELIGNGGIAIDLDREDDGDKQFSIDVAEGTTLHEVDVAPDGTATLDETEQREVDGDDQREIDTAEVTMIEAIEAALAHQPGTIDDVDLETENGTVVWSVDYDDDRDLNVDAVTGEVTEDSDDDDDSDD
ncbi:MAG: PepSY domain-containing protein [Gulosibacter sp.]|uniref:PepSY domain-containing protein n=1 Tax=Gulosibacter sp. TaxID=2817531 RepID=UPI003F9399A7